MAMQPCLEAGKSITQGLPGVDIGRRLVLVGNRQQSYIFGMQCAVNSMKSSHDKLRKKVVVGGIGARECINFP